MAQYFINKSQKETEFDSSGAISSEESNFRSNSTTDIALDIYVDTTDKRFRMGEREGFSFGSNYTHKNTNICGVSIESFSESIPSINCLNSNPSYEDTINPTHNPNSDKIITKLFKPNIKVIPVKEKLSLDEIHDAIFQVSITTPGVNKILPMTEIEAEIKTQIRKNIEESLSFQFQELFEELECGNLLFFDNLQISTNEDEWDTITCYFFQKIILLIHQLELVGQIHLDDICSMNKIKNGVVLNLTREMIPELYIRHENSIVLMKWIYHLNYYITNRNAYPEENIHLLQFSTNAWSLINSQTLTNDIREFMMVIKNNSEIPKSLVGKILPPMESVPLNLIISVSLINNTTLSNKKYRQYLIKTLRKAKESLQDKDSLGLIFVGIDKVGNLSNKGTFVGFVSPNWEGWDDVFDRIEVFPNILDLTIVEELSIVVKKCNILSLFLPKENNCLNKLIFISSNQDIAAKLPLKDTVEELGSLLNKVSISFTIIANSLIREQNYISRILSKAERTTSRLGSLVFGTSLTRVDDWESIPFIICELIKTYQRTTIPNVKIQIHCNSNRALVVDNDRGNISYFSMEQQKFNILMNGLEPNKTKKFEIRFTNQGLDKIKSTSVSPTLKYQISWLDEIDDLKEVK